MRGLLFIVVISKAVVILEVRSGGADQSMSDFRKAWYEVCLVLVVLRQD